SKLSRNELTLGQVDLSTMVREIFSELKRNEPQRDAELLVRDVIKVTADADLMHIMLENLIGNAWKYSSKKPTTTIEIGTAVRNNQSMIYIRDNGAGFDMTYSQRLFEAFQRLHRADEFPGTGVGLATVQRIVHRHGGTICAESEINKGATFYFALGKC
ncbi:MAG: ATP-binding protein, partial [Bdellovibrionales bacterium]